MDTNRLISLREHKGWSKTETAKRLNIATSTYAGYEYGHRKPDSDMLLKLSTLFEVTTDYLLGNKPKIIESFDDMDVLMFNDKEGFDNLSEEDKQELKDLLNDQLEYLIYKKNKKDK